MCCLSEILFLICSTPCLGCERNGRFGVAEIIPKPFIIIKSTPFLKKELWGSLRYEKDISYSLWKETLAMVLLWSWLAHWALALVVLWTAWPLMLVLCGFPFILCLVFLDSKLFGCDSASQCVHTESFRVQITSLACRCLHSMSDHSSCCVKFVVFFFPTTLFLCRDKIGFLLISPSPPTFIMNFRFF